MHLTTNDLRDTVTVEPTNALGDWYANLLIIERQHLVMFVSARSRLCILVYARDIHRLTKRFEDALIEVLKALQISEEVIQRELNAMTGLCYGLTTGTSEGRSVLGSMNDFMRPLEHAGLKDRSLYDWNLYFTEWMCGPLGYKYPGEVARHLLEAPNRLDNVEPTSL
jgi:hypothetical protein